MEEQKKQQTFWGLIMDLYYAITEQRLVNYKDKSVLFEKPMAENHVKELIKIADENKVHINLYQDNIWYV